jgi:TolB-like protein/class 3 adenylate cyclase
MYESSHQHTLSSHQLAAIMFTDIVGYTALMGADEDQAFVVLQRNQEIHRTIVKQFNGTLIKEIGDGMLISFSLASEAVKCAIEIQKICKEQDYQLKIGIHEGEMVFAEEDVYGDGVNIASRLQEVAGAGCIAISERVYADVKNKVGINTRYVGNKRLKNVDEPVKVYEVQCGEFVQEEHHNGESAQYNKIHGKNRYIIFSGIVILVIAAFLGWQHFSEQPVAELEKSIAVLPLSSLSKDPENQFFADGIVEDLLNRLSHLKEFKVVSRTSSEMYRERGTKSVPEIAKELGVSYIIEGSVQRNNNKVRITIQLIDAQRDAHIWSNIFNRDLEDVFKTQSDIALTIASELKSVLTNQQTVEIRKNRTESVKAFEMYQIGRFYWNKRTEEGYLKSIDYFEQALREDPEYGLGYAGLADSYNLMAIQGFVDKKEGRDKAVDFAKKALALDKTLAVAHTVLASIYTYVDFNWEEAEYEYLKAIEINPNYSTAHHYYSEQLSITGRHELAREQINIAIELDPLSFVIRIASTKIYFNRGLFQQAYKENERSRELNQNRDHRWIAMNDFLINWYLGKGPAALDGFKRYYGEIRSMMNPSEIDSIYSVSGLRGLMESRLELTTRPYIKAMVHGYLGSDKEAMDWLERAVNEEDFSIEFTFKYAFRNLHTNPRYKALLQQVGLADS